MASKLLGLNCHLILRNIRALADSDPGLVGNLMVERLAGATIHQVHYPARMMPAWLQPRHVGVAQLILYGLSSSTL